MTNEPALRTTVKDRLAPGWHTAVLIIYLLFPLSLTPVGSAVAKITHENERAVFYLTTFAWETIAISLMIWGLFLIKTPVFRLLGQRKSSDIGIAALSWVIFIGTAAFIRLAVGRFDNSSYRILPQTAKELIAFLPFVVFVGVAEELLFRGYLQTQFSFFTHSRVVGLVVQATVFSLAHGYTQTIAGFLDKFILGLLLGTIVLWRKSLFPAILAHVLLNASVGILSVLTA